MKRIVSFLLIVMILTTQFFCAPSISYGNPSNGTSATNAPTGAPKSTSAPNSGNKISSTTKPGATKVPTKVTWPKAPTIEAESAIIMEVSTGTILYEKNIYDKHYPASITKILTSLIAIENSSLDDVVTFSYDSVHSLEYGSTHIGMREGEQITMTDCLYALLLASANEVANAMAEHVSGSREEFAKLMNDYAKRLGCVNSNFVNPSGLHNDNHYTCAYDMALISREALANDTFRLIDSSRTYVVPMTNLVDQQRPVAHHHQMFMGNKVGFTQYKYEGCFGGKTGYTDTARNTLVTFAKRDDMELICVVMRTSVHGQYKDSTALLDYGFNNFTKHSITDLEGNNSSLNDGSALFTRYFSICDISNSLITIGSDASLVLPSTVPYSDAVKEIAYYDDITLTTGANVIGKITYTYGEKEVGQTNIIMNCDSDILSTKIDLPSDLKTVDDDALTEEDEESFFSRIPFGKIFTIIGLIIVGLIVLRLIMVFLYKRRRRFRRSYRRYKRFMASRTTSRRRSYDRSSWSVSEKTRTSPRSKKRRRRRNGYR